jgi:hypothetical protein
MGAPLRLCATMSSRKLQALDFIKRYFAKWGHSPTLGEIGAHLGVSPKRAHDLVHQLAIEKMIEHISGKARGIRLVDRGQQLSEADVLLRLSSLGWTIGTGGVIEPPIAAAFPHRRGAECPVPTAPGDRACGPLTEKELPLVAELDHDPAIQDQAGIYGSKEPGADQEGPRHT